MFQIKGWPSQDYWNLFTSTIQMGNGQPGAPTPNYASDIASANYIKRSVAMAVLEGRVATTELSDEDLESVTMIVDQYGEEAAILPDRWRDPSSPRPTHARMVTAVPEDEQVPQPQTVLSAGPTLLPAAARTTAAMPIPVQTASKCQGHRCEHSTGAKRRHGHGHGW